MNSLVNFNFWYKYSLFFYLFKILRYYIQKNLFTEKNAFYLALLVKNTNNFFHTLYC
jgi:hypothetical protein